MKITIGDHKYGLKKTTKGERYITREMSKKGFSKWKEGKLENRSGIVNLPKIFNAKSKALSKAKNK